MSLRAHICRRIATDGPLSIAEYMTECLLHPKFGYYTTRDPFGLSGDFVTAPEISQTFGELIGLAIAQSWIDQGAPSPFTLAELGPGRGTLMADILRATAKVPGFIEAAEIVLLEASATLQDVQRKTLGNTPVQWIADVNALPAQPLFLVANEFFDALPVRQFVRDQEAWRERCVGIKDDALCFGLTDSTAPALLAERLKDTKDGDLVEMCVAARNIASTISLRISGHGGMALIIDYGDWRSLGDTLQALKAHQPVDPLADPGNADLTAHVDFEALCNAADCAHTRLTPQGIFLERLGITERTQALARSVSGPALEALIAAHRRLTHPDEMGNLFKVLGLYPPDAAPPPGLEP